SSPAWPDQAARPSRLSAAPLPRTCPRRPGRWGRHGARHRQADRGLTRSVNPGATVSQYTYKMLRVLGCISNEHDFRLVLLAGLVCAIGSYTALSLLARARETGSKDRSSAWLAAAGVVCGASVWTTHFIAMLAYKSSMVVGYDPDLTLLSIALAIALS